jgi:NADH-ubiquinone oxidoreductase chain 2
MLLSCIFIFILSNALSFNRESSVLYNRIGILMLLYCIYLSYNNLFIIYLDKGIGLFGGLFYTSSITQLFHIVILILSLLILNITGFFPRKLVHKEYNTYIKLFKRLNFINKTLLSYILSKKGEQYNIIEYPLIIFFIVMGSILLISCSDLISLFLSIELQSYGLYLLCAMYRNSESSTSASLTYYLLGGLASCFILLGIGLIYANLGVTNLDSFFIVNSLFNILAINGFYSYVPYCLILIGIGLLFKISAAPFHF